MEKRLYSAAVKGNVTALRELLEEDESVLERVILTPHLGFNDTVLHVAVMHGHVDFAKEILRQKPQLAEELDSQKLSPLHVAASKGYLEIVEALLDVKPDMCFAGDKHGRNPLHLSAMNGRVEVLKVLLRKMPRAAREKASNNQTILHLCVKHNQLEALRLLVKDFYGDDEFVNAKDLDGNTILHLAVMDEQSETMKYLMNNSTRMDLYEKNARGETAVDILLQTTHQKDHGKEDWFSKKREAIMVVASLIATMAFQVGVNPTGGVWQDNVTEGESPHVAGEAVIAYHHPHSYRYFIRANTIAFVSSLSTILLLISGLPWKRMLFMWALRVIMWLTITSIALTYAISIVVLTPEDQRAQLSKVIDVAVTVWCAVMGLLLLGNTIRLVYMWWMSRRSGKSNHIRPHGNGNQQFLQMICIK